MKLLSDLSACPCRFRGWVLLYLVGSGVACVNVSPPWSSASGGGSGRPSTMRAGGSIVWSSGAGGNPWSSSAIDATSNAPGPDTDAPAPLVSELDANGGAYGKGGTLAGTGGSQGNAGATGTGGTSEPQGVDGGAFDSGAGGAAGSSSTAGRGGASGSGGASTVDAPLDGSSSDAACPLCLLGAALVHRYSFSGTGSTITDSVGAAHGTAMNAPLSGSGSLTLSGGTDQYVDLPDGILSSLEDATIELWVSWAGGAPNQRIYDFGSNGMVNGKLQATTTVILSPNSAPTGLTPRLRASYSNQVSLSGTFVDGTGALPTGTMSHLVAVFDGQKHELSLYLNGVLQGTTSGLGALSLIRDSNNWLGHSQYAEDPGFAGTYYELRIYAAALSAQQVQANGSAGPNATLRP